MILALNTLMKLGILSFKRAQGGLGYGDTRLFEAAKQLGHEVTLLDMNDLELVAGGELQVLLRGKALPALDVIIPRPRVIQMAEHHSAIVEALELSGHKLLNSYASICKAKNKQRTMQLLATKGVPTPKTVAVTCMDRVEAAVELLGGAPVVVKSAYGTYGSGVVLAESLQAARSIADIFWCSGFINDRLLFQEYIEEAKGSDRRILVMNGKVLAAMQRQAQAGEFRSNVKLGASAQPYQPTPEEVDTALRAARALGLGLAGVDLIPSQRGSLVLEVNCNPGFEALEACTGLDIASKIIQNLN